MIRTPRARPDAPPTTRRRTWGRWTLDPHIRTASHAATGYEIDLDRATTAAEMLDWIFQVHGTQWATPDDVHSLLALFEDVIDPQARLCSFGAASRPVDVRALVAAAVAPAVRR